MTNTNQQTDRTAALRAAAAERIRLQAKYERLTEKISELTDQLEAIDTFIGLMRQGGDLEVQEATPLVSPKELQGMTQLDAVAYMAKRNNGRIKITVARDLLKRAHLMGATKNGYNIVSTIIKRSGRFTHSGRGEYELVEEDKAGRTLRAIAS